MFEEFVDSDIRKNRPTATVTEESLTNRFEVMLPAWLVKGQRVLDLGSALGAAGHWCLHHGAAYYTGVELQKPAVKKSQDLLSLYHDPKTFNIINKDLVDFIHANKNQWDIVIAAGVVHGFFNVFDILQKISQLSSKYLVVETLNIPEINSIPTIHLCPMNMVKYLGDNLPYRGITPLVGINAFDVIMNECGFVRDGDQLFPKRIADSHDAYNDIMLWRDLPPSAQRFIARYKKSNTHTKSLETRIRENITEPTGPAQAIHDGVPISKNTAVWQFDDSVAERFYDEAITNIPDYERVVDMCLKIAQSKFSLDATIVDVGSALGYTVDKFIKQGFDNTIGVESSQSMINHSVHQDKIISSDTFPKNITADLVLANWTLHFITERKQYLQDIFDALNFGGVVIITDKTAQSDTVKKLYHDFKRNNGVSESYIIEKEEKLKGYMNCFDSCWYLETLAAVGFKNIQIINSNLGFVTFYAEK